MEKKKQRIIGLLSALICIGAVACHYWLSPWGFYSRVSPEEAALRLQVVQTAQSWLHANEADGSHKPILAVYNAHEPLAVGYTVQDTDSWCSVFVSAVAIRCGVTDILPTECGCQRHIDLFKALGRWDERDGRVPQPGDLIFYDWEDSGLGDAGGWSDHVGIVVGVKWPFFQVIEGNYEDQVKERILRVNEPTIRGFGLPDYAGKVK